MTSSSVPPLFVRMSATTNARAAAMGKLSLASMVAWRASAWVVRGRSNAMRHRHGSGALPA